MVWFWLALCALLCWSGSDIFSKIGSKTDDKYSHWKMVITVGTAFGLHAMYQIFVGGTQVTLHTLIAYLPASALYIGSMVLGYVGLRYIELSVSSPICNSSGALVFLAMCLVMPDQVDTSLLPVLAVALVCLGVLTLGIVEMMEDEEAKLRRREPANVRYAKSFIALLFPILYCVLDAGGGFAAIYIMNQLTGDAMTARLGGAASTLTGDALAALQEEVETVVALQCNTAYELTFLLIAVLAFIYVVVIKKQRLTVRREGPKALAAVCETAGQLCYALVMADTDHAAFGAAIIASYCALSAIWARIFLKEKLSWKHYVAIGMTVTGIIALGLFDI